ncbi:MAG: hypothetical protein EPO22_12455, partial [Dehalococcoidia bacterium]
MQQNNVRTMLLLAPAVIAGFAAVALSSNVDPTGLRVSLQAVTVLAFVTMAWANASAAPGGRA